MAGAHIATYQRLDGFSVKDLMGFRAHNCLTCNDFLMLAGKNIVAPLCPKITRLSKRAGVTRSAVTRVGNNSLSDMGHGMPS
jgi:hypothetical protein